MRMMTKLPKCVDANMIAKVEATEAYGFQLIKNCQNLLDQFEKEKKEFDELGDRLLNHFKNQGKDKGLVLPKELSFTDQTPSRIEPNDETPQITKETTPVSKKGVSFCGQTSFVTLDDSTLFQSPASSSASATYNVTQNSKYNEKTPANKGISFSGQTSHASTATNRTTFQTPDDVLLRTLFTFHEPSSPTATDEKEFLPSVRSTYTKSPSSSLSTTIQQDNDLSQTPLSQRANSTQSTFLSETTLNGTQTRSVTRNSKSLTTNQESNTEDKDSGTTQETPKQAGKSSLSINEQSPVIAKTPENTQNDESPISESPSPIYPTQTPALFSNKGHLTTLVDTGSSFDGMSAFGNPNDTGRANSNAKRAFEKHMDDEMNFYNPNQTGYSLRNRKFKLPPRKIELSAASILGNEISQHPSVDFEIDEKTPSKTTTSIIEEIAEPVISKDDSTEPTIPTYNNPEDRQHPDEGGEQEMISILESPNKRKRKLENDSTAAVEEEVEKPEKRSSQRQQILKDSQPILINIEEKNERPVQESLFIPDMSLGSALLPGDDPALLPGEGSAILPGEGSALLPGEGSALLPGEGSALLPGEVPALLPGEGPSILPEEPDVQPPPSPDLLQDKENIPEEQEDLEPEIEFVPIPLFDEVQSSDLPTPKPKKKPAPKKKKTQRKKRIPLNMPKGKACNYFIDSKYKSGKAATVDTSSTNNKNTSKSKTTKSKPKPKQTKKTAEPPVTYIPTPENSPSVRITAIDQTLVDSLFQPPAPEPLTEQNHTPQASTSIARGRPSPVIPGENSVNCTGCTSTVNVTDNRSPDTPIEKILCQNCVHALNQHNKTIKMGKSILKTKPKAKGSAKRRISIGGVTIMNSSHSKIRAVSAPSPAITRRSLRQRKAVDYVHKIRERSAALKLQTIVEKSQSIVQQQSHVMEQSTSNKMTDSNTSSQTTSNVALSLSDTVKTRRRKAAVKTTNNGPIAKKNTKPTTRQNNNKQKQAIATVSTHRQTPERTTKPSLKRVSRTPIANSPVIKLRKTSVPSPAVTRRNLRQRKNVSQVAEVAAKKPKLSQVAKKRNNSIANKSKTKKNNLQHSSPTKSRNQSRSRSTSTSPVNQKTNPKRNQKTFKSPSVESLPSNKKKAQKSPVASSSNAGARKRTTTPVTTKTRKRVSPVSKTAAPVTKKRTSPEANNNKKPPKPQLNSPRHTIQTQKPAAGATAQVRANESQRLSGETTQSFMRRKKTLFKSRGNRINTPDINEKVLEPLDENRLLGETTRSFLKRKKTLFKSNADKIQTPESSKERVMNSTAVMASIPAPTLGDVNISEIGRRAGDRSTTMMAMSSRYMSGRLVDVQMGVPKSLTDLVRNQFTTGASKKRK